MKKILKPVFIILFVILPAFSFAQDLNAHSPKPAPGSVQQRKADKKREAQQKKMNKSIEAGKKKQMKIQSKQTRKMMRKSKKNYERWNQERKEFFHNR